MLTENGTYTSLLLGLLRSSYEKDPESGLSYVGARYYDSDLSIFNSTDPMWHKYPHLTPYHYCSNNPIMRVDPDGMADDWWQNETTGEVYYSKNHNKQAVAEVNSFLGNGLLGGDVGNWSWLGEDNMFGDTPDNVLNAYTNGTAGTGLSVFSLAENSEDFMNTHGYKSVPTQLTLYTQSNYQVDLGLGNKIMKFDMSRNVEIGEKYNYVPKQYQAIKKSILQTYSRVSKGEIVQRLSIQYGGNSNIMTKIINTITSLNGSFDYTTTSRYKNWNTYTNRPQPINEFIKRYGTK